MAAHRFLIFLLALFCTFTIVGGVSIPISEKIVYQDCQGESSDHMYDPNNQYCINAIERSYLMTSDCHLLVINSKDKSNKSGYGFRINSPQSCKEVSITTKWAEQGIELSLFKTSQTKPSIILIIDKNNFLYGR